PASSSRRSSRRSPARGQQGDRGRHSRQTHAAPCTAERRPGGRETAGPSAGKDERGRHPCAAIRIAFQVSRLSLLVLIKNYAPERKPSSPQGGDRLSVSPVGRLLLELREEPRLLGDLLLALTPALGVLRAQES